MNFIALHRALSSSLVPFVFAVSAFTETDNREYSLGQRMTCKESVRLSLVDECALPLAEISWIYLD